MLQQIPTETVVLQKWLTAGYIENLTLFPTEAGTPQGGIISPTLAEHGFGGLTLERRIRDEEKSGVNFGVNQNAGFRFRLQPRHGLGQRNFVNRNVFVRDPAAFSGAMQIGGVK